MSDIASRVKAIIVDKLGVDENEVVHQKQASLMI
jgi:acyl carrier protein